ncbi:MAG TPA: hypothetical protein VGL77_09670, partial [Armatimonadota bacterium]
MRRLYLLLAVLVLLVLTLPFRHTIIRYLRGDRTVNDRLREYGPAARARLAPAFKLAGVTYPPQRLALLGLKCEK